MEDQIISLETAKLAKEKGFNLKQPKAYYILEDKREMTLWVDPTVEEELKKIGWAPTQNLLQRWLREVHNIKVLADYFCISSDDYEWGYVVKYEEGNDKRECQRLKSIESVEFYPGGYQNPVAFVKNTYEEAIEQGLREALKLIK